MYKVLSFSDEYEGIMRCLKEFFKTYEKKNARSAIVLQTENIKNCTYKSLTIYVFYVLFHYKPVTYI